MQFYLFFTTQSVSKLHESHLLRQDDLGSEGGGICVCADILRKMCLTVMSCVSPHPRWDLHLLLHLICLHPVPEGYASFGNPLEVLRTALPLSLTLHGHYPVT